MTEAQALSLEGISEYSFLDQTLISSFISEMVALIPKKYWNDANRFMADELEQRKGQGNEVPERVRTVLEEQTLFLGEP